MKREDRYLLDTDIIIYWLKNKYPQINNKIEEAGDSRIFISSITVAELYYGAYHSSKPKENYQLINELVTEINVLNFDAEAGEQFGKIKTDLKRTGKIINDSDLFIAASAICRDMILITNNEKHFQRIENLKIQNWTK